MAVGNVSFNTQEALQSKKLASFMPLHVKSSSVSCVERLPRFNWLTLKNGSWKLEDDPLTMGFW